MCITLVYIVLFTGERKNPKQYRCHLCEIHAITGNYCNECAVWLCHTCTISHANLKSTAEHIVTQAELPKSNMCDLCSSHVITGRCYDMDCQSRSWLCDICTASHKRLCAAHIVISLRLNAPKPTQTFHKTDDATYACRGDRVRPVHSHASLDVKAKGGADDDGYSGEIAIVNKPNTSSQEMTTTLPSRE